MPAPPATAPTGRVDPAEVAARIAEVDALAEIPVGPDLAAALAGVDGDRLPGPGLVGLMEARHRQANHERGELLAAVGRILLHDVAGGARMWKGPDGVAVDQVRASLRLTRSAAKRLCELTWDLHKRLAPVLAAMREGVLDQPRAQVFSSWTQGLTPEHTAAVLWAAAAHRGAADHRGAHRRHREAGHRAGSGVGAPPLRAGAEGPAGGGHTQPRRHRHPAAGR